MKVLLTGGNGFVGSHVLDRLRERGTETVLLLRRTSDTRLIREHLDGVEVRRGSLGDAQSLREAARDATHVVHCAGKTKVLRSAEFYEVNRDGTRNLVEALNAQAGRVRRLVHVSSLAAAGPGTPQAPAREDQARSRDGRQRR